MKKPQKLYRDMVKDTDGLPKLGANSKKLGVRILGFNKKPGQVTDMTADEDGNIEPGKGMSVTPPDIKENIRDFAAERIADGDTVLWEIDESVLAPLSLKFVQDADDHGIIEAAHKMSAERYTTLIASTRKFWRESNDL
ncbi:hypothetical protein VINI7043_05576 [Vibrio nigripulchritudo ATCC 27043]|uniref:Tse2 family ADP-ribosyltransferase toxin n=1 Tax=Vibrio nigripulchritudo TaxID=28173 RepID=UPI00021C1BB7|nr:hypothetical protein [Vibrio nigripulchritudo]EGU59894.1 hypothetical protein VINI7043_05576 [Vibrio nigripulchritudo ATCC 27043]